MVNSKLILESKAKGKNYNIAVTPLTSKKQIKELKENVETNKNYLNTLRPKLISKNKSRPPRTKFKGPAEDIYKAYAKSVVFIANYKKVRVLDLLLIIKEKNITNWHVVEGSKKVRVWLKPKI